jgi:prepilin-type N-terminal cleavage/methylation domain-containing protein
MYAVMNKKWRFTKNQKGLTLIELLAVIVVLGIVSAIAVPAVAGVIDKSKDRADVATDLVVKQAALSYILANSDTITTTQTDVLISTLVGTYLNAAPTWAKSANTKTKYTATLTSGSWVITLS